MKKSILTLATFTALTFASCSNSENKTENGVAITENTTATVSETPAEPEAAASIVGTWKLTEVDLGMTPPKGQEKTFEDLKKDMVAKTIYTFGEDGTINLTTSMAKSNGTYTLDGSKLTTVINNKTESATVESLTASELVIAVEDHGSKMVMKFQK